MPITSRAIVRLRWPFTDLSAEKVRPALALGEPDHNGDVSLCMTTTSDHIGSNLLIRAEDYATTQLLPRESWLRLDRQLKAHQEALQVNAS
jgi:hypothetical protein